MSTRPYLLAKSLRLPLEQSPFVFDTESDINTVEIDGHRVPAALACEMQDTMSKTMAAPGDDDPDPDDEDCY